MFTKIFRPNTYIVLLNSWIIVSVSTSNINRSLLFTLNCIFWLEVITVLNINWLYTEFCIIISRYRFPEFMSILWFALLTSWYKTVSRFRKFFSDIYVHVSIFSKLRYLPFKHRCSEIMVIGRYTSCKISLFL